MNAHRRTRQPAWCRKEIGHIRADHETRFLDDYHRSPACRGRAEVEAESIAYLVTTLAGLDSSNYTVPYVANWSGGDTAILRETATKVLTAGRQIVQTLRLDTPDPADSHSAPSTAYTTRRHSSEQTYVHAVCVGEID
jgi:hypothetical protein